MIASLHGKLEMISGDWAVVNVSGVGFRVYMPSSTMTKLGLVGEEVHLQTSLVLREDSVTLYGFSTDTELEMFNLLTGVSGLGPRLALAALSAMSVEQIATAIAGENADVLKLVPGIGKKMAERLILELKEKVGAGLISVVGVEMAADNADVVTALSSLGYSIAEASRAVASLPESPDMELEEKVRLALQYFTQK